MSTRLFGGLALCWGGLACAAGLPTGVLEEAVVTAKRYELLGKPVSASQGTVLAEQLINRPILRTAEVLEVVPGLIVTQHSGDGKANQYFLRGFNLDHGTDFASTVDGLPVNMPTHGHGQGYSDLNFLIPELIDRLDYRKGTYYAEQGNFSAAGAVGIHYKRTLDRPFVTLSAGEDQYQRALLAASPELGDGDLLLAVSYEHTNGPWDLSEHLRKVNGLAKYSHGTNDTGWSLTFMGYDGSWDSTDQIPLRAVQSGQIDRFGFIDPTDGGESYRYSLSGDAWGQLGAGDWRALVYAIDYHLDLVSNFTYFTDTENGDQFEQRDDRTITGGDFRYRQALPALGHDAEWLAGAQIRRDDVSPVGLYRTVARQRIGTIRQDEVTQTSYAAFTSLDLRWAPWLRSEIGLRADQFNFDVRSDLAVNSGSADDSIVSPKLSVTFGPWADTEYFLNVGRGFHSNDARGTTITVDPNDGTPVDRVDPLVRATGSEIGVRTGIIPNVQIAASLWTLKLDSELLFVGDGGTTEASRPTRRTGFEMGIYYKPVDWLIADADLAWSRPRFTDNDSVGDRIPGAVERVFSVGLAIDRPDGWFGGARLRYLGPAALIEDDSVRASSTTLVNLDAGYRFSERWSAQVTLLNAFDEQGNDITYFYESQLPGEAAPVEDIHFHPVEPRTIRASITVKM
jgi:TonB dependent receptor/TonB-dependent Receptor Plug Domain